MWVEGDPLMGADLLLLALHMADYQVVHIEPTEDIDEVMEAWRAFRPPPHQHPAACRCGRCAKAKRISEQEPEPPLSPALAAIREDHQRALTRLRERDDSGSGQGADRG